MFCLPRNRPGPLIAIQLRALESYRRALAYAALEAAAKATKRYAGPLGQKAASRPRRIYEYMESHRRADNVAMRNDLGMTADEFRNAMTKLVKQGLVNRLGRGVYEIA